MTDAREDSTSRRNYHIPDATQEALRRMAWEKRLTISQVVRDALHSYKPLREYLDEGGVR